MKGVSMRPRITVTEQAVHQPADALPTAVEWPPFSRELRSDEQPYGPRRVAAGPRWQRLDQGWLDGAPVGMLFLRNEGAGARETRPTEEERALDAALVVELSLCPDGGASQPPFALVRPGETCRYEPHPQAPPPYLRCPCGTVRVSYVLYPA